jgi:hypothetical protein
LHDISPNRVGPAENDPTPAHTLSPTLATDGRRRLQPSNRRRKEMTIESKNPETMVLHAGPRSDYATGAVAVPIFQTTSYEFRSNGTRQTCSRSRTSATSTRAS